MRGAGSFRFKCESWLNFSGDVELFSIILRRGGRVEGMRRWHPAHFMRHKWRRGWAGHVAALLHITRRPPTAAIQTEGKNHGSEEEGNEKAREGQEAGINQAANYGHKTLRLIHPETVRELAGMLLGAVPARLTH